MAHEYDLHRYRVWYARLLRLFPPRHRARFGEGMAQTFNDLLRERARSGRAVAGHALGLFAETGVQMVKSNIDAALRHRFVLRPAIVAGGLLMIPLVMTVLDRDKPPGEGWRWDPGSFVVMGLLLFGAGLACEWVASRVSRPRLRFALFGAIVCAVLLIWAELAVDAVSQWLRFVSG